MKYIYFLWEYVNCLKLLSVLLFDTMLKIAMSNKSFFSSPPFLKFPHCSRVPTRGGHSEEPAGLGHEWARQGCAGAWQRSVPVWQLEAGTGPRCQRAGSGVIGLRWGEETTTGGRTQSQGCQVSKQALLMSLWLLMGVIGVASLWPLMNSFNKIKAAISPCRLCFLRTLPFFLRLIFLKMPVVFFSCKGVGWNF